MFKTSTFSIFARLASALLLSAVAMGASAQAAKTVNGMDPVVCFWNIAKCDKVDLGGARTDIALTWKREDASSVNPLHIAETADNWAIVKKQDLGDGTQLVIYSDGQTRRENIPQSAVTKVAGDVIYNNMIYQAPLNSAFVESIGAASVQAQAKAGMVWNGQEWACPAEQEMNYGNCRSCASAGKVWNGTWCMCPAGTVFIAGECEDTHGYQPKKR